MKGTAVPAKISILVLLACLFGCAKSEPRVSVESPPSVLTDIGNPVTQTQDISSPVQTTVSEVLPSPNTEIMLFNEFISDDKGLLSLGMTRDNVIKILEENNIDYGTYDNEAIDLFYQHDGYMIILDGENHTVNAVEIGRPKWPDKASPRRLLYIGDTIEKMEELYGNDYTVSSTEDNEYQIYTYKFGDQYFEVWFQSELVSMLRIEI